MKYYQQEIPIGTYLYGGALSTPKTEITRDHALHLAGANSAQFLRGEKWINEGEWRQTFTLEGNQVRIHLQP